MQIGNIVAFWRGQQEPDAHRHVLAIRRDVCRSPVNGFFEV